MLETIGDDHNPQNENPHSATAQAKRFAPHTFGGNAVEILAQALVGCPVTVLDLADSSIDDREVRTLATCLPGSHLKHLDLSDNPMIKVAGAFSIAEFGGGLESLSLQNTALSGTALTGITDTLPVSALQHLNLRSACPFVSASGHSPWMQSLRGFAAAGFSTSHDWGHDWGY